jgi:hypothetical protein
MGDIGKKGPTCTLAPPKNYKKTILPISAEKKPNIITMFAYVQENIETVPFH